MYMYLRPDRSQVQPSLPLHSLFHSNHFNGQDWQVADSVISLLSDLFKLWDLNGLENSSNMVTIFSPEMDIFSGNNHSCKKCTKLALMGLNF